MRPCLFFALPSDTPFTERLAGAAGGELGRLVTHDFPDGETYLRLETSPAQRDVVIVATLHHPNDKLLPLLLLADAAKQLGASRVGLVAPYLAYMRQDARFHEGEAVTLKSFAELLSTAFDWLITVDPHLHRIHKLSDVYRIPATAIHATSELGVWIAQNVTSPVLVGPDEESRQWVGAVAAAANTPFVVLTKTRRGDSDVSVSVPELDRYPGRTPVLIDDIISTGQTMAAAARHIRDERGLSAICVGVHAVFAAAAAEAIRGSGAARVVTTNTIAHPSNGIDVVPALAEALSRVASPAV
jgi:ribose-phosphate pyrophosphokinase